MSAAARAEARKKAILSRGSDRLAKLTSSARGEEAASVYVESQKRQVVPDPPLPSLDSFVGDEPSPPAFDAVDIDPQQFLAQMLSANQQSAPVIVEQQRKPAASSALQKFLPLVHWLAVWALLLYFVFWVEPSSNSTPVGILDRWGALLKHKPDDFLAISIVPFFWAFTTVQVVLHSLRIFGGFVRSDFQTKQVLIFT